MHLCIKLSTLTFFLLVSPICPHIFTYYKKTVYLFDCSLNSNHNFVYTSPRFLLPLSLLCHFSTYFVISSLLPHRICLSQSYLCVCFRLVARELFPSVLCKCTRRLHKNQSGMQLSKFFCGVALGVFFAN